MKSKAACRGFSLLEVLVAFTILAMVLGALFHLFSTGMLAAQKSDRYSRATVIAQSKLDELGVEYALSEGVTSGTTDDDFHWRITVNAYTDDQLPATDLPLRPLSVNVDVFWEEGGNSRTFTLMSMMLGPA